MNIEQIESDFNGLLKNPLVLLSIICGVSIIIRLIFVPYGLPVTLDAFTSYFWYALDISILGNLPNYTLAQSGWSEFLSLFFMLFSSDNLITYMDLQRTVSVVLSSITVIPIYFICKKFFNSNYSLIGAIIFALEPGIIINSTLGISEPLYILSITLGILLFLNSNKKVIYLSFGFFAWATIIRPEGQFWFIAFSIIYFLRFRKKRKDLIMFLICLSIFLLVLSPIVIHRIQCCDTDAIVGRILIETSNYVSNSIESNIQTNSYGPNFVEGIKLFGWSLFPIFSIFVPIGLVFIFRQFNYPNYLLIGIPVILSVPILYSVSIAPDTRYVYPLFPIFCVISLFGIKWIYEKFQNKKIISIIVIIVIVSSSIVFLDIKKVNFTEDIETYQISKLLMNDIKGVNEGPKIIQYMQIVELENKWPFKETTGEQIKEYEIKTTSSSNYNNLNEFLTSQKLNITHLVVDENERNPDYILNILINENNFPYLIKEFDSLENHYNYHVKIYRIDYNIFNNTQN